jgi:hypothetical protein
MIHDARPDRKSRTRNTRKCWHHGASPEETTGVHRFVEMLREKAS